MSALHDASRWWGEALRWARLAESDSIGILVVTSMAGRTFDGGHEREAVDLSQPAMRMARKTATPRLTSLLLVREAVGHAKAGDRTNAQVMMSRASRLADHARHDDDPAWLDFYGPSDFAHHEHRAALMLGDHTTGETIARTALPLGDPVAYPRSHAIDLVTLADVLAQRGEIDESAALGTQAAKVASNIDSHRMTVALRELAGRLAPYQDEPNVHEFLR